MSLDRARLEFQLGGLFVEHSQVSTIADQILSLEPSWQNFVLDSVILLARTQPEIAGLFAGKSRSALRALGRNGCEDWLQAAITVYFEQGVEAATQHLNSLDDYIQQQRQRSRGLELPEVQRVLQFFMHGLDGRRMSIEASKECLTDSEILHLPIAVDYYSDRHQNFACFKAIAVHQWAQCRYGTWHADTIDQIPRKAPMLPTFHYLEVIRLNACLKRDYPGLARLMDQFQPETPDIWKPVEQTLSHPEASVADSIRLSQDWWDIPRPDPALFQGKLDPDKVQHTLEVRLQREARQFRDSISRLMSEQSDREEIKDSGGNNPALMKLEFIDNAQFELSSNGKTLILDTATRELMESIRQDLGQVPREYLEGIEPFDAKQDMLEIEDQSDSNPSDALKTYVYDEWDYQRNDHREDWCTLREKVLEPNFQSDFVQQTLQKYQGQIKSLKRSFEALRDEYHILKKQPDGEEPDLDAMVEALCDVRSGREMSSRLYRKAHRVERNIAVIFMVDMSGSTKGWINTTQRESLVMLAEAMQALNDRYAIYGFSGITRKRCDLFRVKSFDEDFDDEIQARISAIEPQEYTRMGVTIRHLSEQLHQVKARTKILITLSDGKPDDYDNYSGQYGIEDTRMALLEARQRGIHPFCITIDEQARDYLPHMYGDSRFILINDANKLPYRISEIYRNLTR
ncbi:MAG: VWA domain-containing protein [Pseudomonadota bacterium]